MENEKAINPLFENIFESDNYPEGIKNDLLNVGDRIHMLLKYDCSVPNIVVYNYNKNELKMYKEGFMKILKVAARGKEIIDYNFSFSGFNRRDKYYYNSIVVVDDFEYFCNNEKYAFDRIVKLMKDKKLSFVILSTRGINNSNMEDKYSPFLSSLNSGFPLYLFKSDDSIDDIYNKVCKVLEFRKIKVDIEQSRFKEFIKLLLDRNIMDNPTIADTLINDLTSIAILDDERRVINECDFVLLYEVDIDEYDIKEEVVVKEEKNIRKMIGLKEVKNEIKSLENYLSFIKKCDSNNKRMYLNMFFMGNPGTGKTTVARMFKDTLFKLGYIKSNKMVEIVPNDLIGEHVGETRAKARDVLNKSKGGLLFIDEAYLLYSKSYSMTGKNPFMEEALVELMKYMEDPRNVVIFAGYPKEMKEVYNANPGLKSRIFKEIEFKDYTNDELYKILDNNLNNYNLKLDKNIKKDIFKYIDSVKRDKDFGNARYMEQLSQILINNHANRKLKDENFIIDINDIPIIKDEKSIKKMGFVGE